MAVTSISIDDFQTSNQATLSEGGPWLPIMDRGNGDTVCESQKWVWCDGYCLVAATFPRESQPSYNTQFTTNISVPLDRYGGATELAFTWNYWPLYCGSAIGTGTSHPIHVQIGSASFDDNLISVDYQRFFSGAYPWDPAPKIPHTGTTSITAGSDGNRGFIPITISMAMKPTGNNEYLNLYIKAISFQITTPTQNVSPAASTSPNPTSATTTTTSTSTNSVTSGASTSLTSNASLVAVPSFSVSDGHTVSISIENSPVSEPSPQVAAKVNTAAIGAAVGSVAFVAILIVLLVLWRRRRLANLPTPTQLQPFTPTPSEKAPFAIQPPPGEGSASPLISSQQASSRTFSTRAESTVQSTYFDPPPIYGSDERIARRPSMSPALVEFARANRTWISEDLQERLTAAGYLPTDDPDNLTEEEWRDFGITKLELLRLRALYARTVQASPSTHSPTPTQTMFSPMSVNIKDRRSRIEEQAISPVGV